VKLDDERLEKYLNEIAAETINIEKAIWPELKPKIFRTPTTKVLILNMTSTWSFTVTEQPGRRLLIFFAQGGLFESK
jgi:hypothetical protein